MKHDEPKKVLYYFIEVGHLNSRLVYLDLAHDVKAKKNHGFGAMLIRENKN